ncbi:GOLPH3/VPS74 family protein [Pseudoclavibacter sp. VKM Ac-2867]|uniref:GOLPH3/VPS74 family protein n=1 Tax=Pseudoclavibacter sp. VKM Ac-2867 TaxID=2783829 RepID=UPI00188BEFBA|nr:GPP34 family phosphoprotein [Pseudoclavibacter sp. VKM Ac-2867]MBF4458784.1 GPP34 family phosphoprotein [Pseudoclavibacter sp. VKM Ac-2867]
MEQLDHIPTTGPYEAQPLLAEDLLLLLFNPDDGTIGGEGTLFYVLAGAVLTELALNDQVAIEKAGMRGTLVLSVGETVPDDEILRAAWEYSDGKRREVQGMLASIGPQLRGQLLESLIFRGDLHREQGKTFGFIPKTTLSLGDTGRRAKLMSRVQAVLIDGAEPDARTAALAALLSASGSLPTLHRELPWETDVINRAKALEAGDWGAAAASSAVARTMNAITINAAVAASVAANANAANS